MQQDYAEVISRAQVLIAEVDSELAGVLVLSEEKEGLLLESIAVHPSQQGTGIGRLLLARAELEARAKGHTSIYLYTNEKMVENIALYLRAGYTEYARRSDNGFDRVFMRKVLTLLHDDAKG
jgi:GNAT superfamily N-acetyltransferase